MNKKTKEVNIKNEFSLIECNLLDIAYILKKLNKGFFLIGMLSALINVLFIIKFFL